MRKIKVGELDSFREQLSALLGSLTVSEVSDKFLQFCWRQMEVGITSYLSGEDDVCIYSIGNYFGGEETVVDSVVTPHSQYMKAYYILDYLQMGTRLIIEKLVILDNQLLFIKAVTPSGHRLLCQLTDGDEELLLGVLGILT